MAGDNNMENKNTLKLDDQLCFAFYACSREIMKLYRPILQDLNLTYTQYITMIALWERDNTTVKDLGQRLYLDSGTLTPLLKKLEAMGLIKRTRDQQDERNVLITVTPEGREMEQAANEIPCKLFQDTEVELEDAKQIHAQVQNLLSKIGSKKS
jgi:DNA-binding MarR family transcriptional regulator